MKWTRERDLLIAQTMAFVQSVTGKKTDAERPWAQADVEAMPIAAERVAIEIIAPTRVAQPTEPIVSAEILAAPAPVSRTSTAGDFRAEIQSRVANFRAHQQRVSREREEYCAATLARMHAASDDLPLRK
jgi:hypothetical protein